MYRRIDDVLEEWQGVAAATQKVMDAMTDASLDQPVGDGHRSLGRVAWHIVQTIPEMMGKTGLDPVGPGEEEPVPASARAIADAYREASRSFAEQVRARWTDASLEEEDMMYGSPWKRGFTVRGLMAHEIHHRGQMTVLLRQAGVRVPGTYGPAKEDWAAMKMQPPAI